MASVVVEGSTGVAVASVVVTEVVEMVVSDVVTSVVSDGEAVASVAVAVAGGSGGAGSFFQQAMVVRARRAVTMRDCVSFFMI